MAKAVEGGDGWLERGEGRGRGVRGILLVVVREGEGVGFWKREKGGGE